MSSPAEQWQKVRLKPVSMTLFQVLLAKRKCDGTFYAVKVLHKKTILKKKEVCLLSPAASPGSQCVSNPGNAIEASIHVDSSHGNLGVLCAMGIWRKE